MTAEELKRDNPWKRYVYSHSLKAYDECSRYVLPEDKVIIDLYNYKAGDMYKFNLHLPPAPFSGNLLTAKIVILSLNPGYVDYLNRELVGMMVAAHRKRFEESAKRHLSLDGNPIYEYDEERIIGENYWVRKLHPLAKAVYGSDPKAQKAIYGDIALFQYIGYFSTKFKDSAILRKLGSLEFSKQVLEHLVYETEVVFLVMRAKTYWEKLFPEGKYAELKSNGRIIDEIRSPLSQAITPNNLKNDDFQRLVNHIKKHRNG